MITHVTWQINAKKHFMQQNSQLISMLLNPMDLLFVSRLQNKWQLEINELVSSFLYHWFGWLASNRYKMIQHFHFNFHQGTEFESLLDLVFPTVLPWAAKILSLVFSPCWCGFTCRSDGSNWNAAIHSGYLKIGCLLFACRWSCCVAVELSTCDRLHHCKLTKPRCNN